MVFEEAKRILLWGLICSSSTVATLFGFTGIAAAAAGIAKCLYFLCLVIYLIFFIVGMSAGRRVPITIPDSDCLRWKRDAEEH